jgi:hypothetical protein
VRAQGSHRCRQLRKKLLLKHVAELQESVTRSKLHEELPAVGSVLRLQFSPPDGGQLPFGNSVGEIALSPDGRTAAFVASAGGKWGIWVRPLDGGEAHLIAGTERAAYPFWSPESNALGFFAGNKLLRVDLAGGAPLATCDVTGGRGGAWSPDGRILFGTVAAGIFQVPASGGTPVPLTTLDASRGEAYHRWPQVLPGGHFLYLALSDPPELSGIFAASLTRPAERTLLLASNTNAIYAPGGQGRNYLLWLHGSTLLAREFSGRPEIRRRRAPGGRSCGADRNPGSDVRLGLGQRRSAVLRLQHDEPVYLVGSGWSPAGSSGGTSRVHGVCPFAGRATGSGRPRPVRGSTFGR